MQHAYDLGLRDARGEGNGKAKLTDEIVLVLRAKALVSSRGFYAAEARRLDVSEATIRDVVSGRTWRHLPLTMGMA